jgi:hypothetical protein
MEKDIESYDVELSDTINDSIENRKAYFVRPFGTEESNGPFQGTDLLKAIKSGGIRQNDLIRRESSNNWHRVDEIAELRHLFQQAQTIKTQNHKTKSIPLKWIILAIVMLTLVIESAFWVGGLTSDLAGDVLIAGLALIVLTLIIGNLGHGIRCVAQIVSYLKSNIKWGLTQIIIGFSKIFNKTKKEFVQYKVAVRKRKKWYSPRNLRWICAVVAICLTIILVGKKDTNSVSNRNTATSSGANSSKPPSQLVDPWNAVYGVNDDSLKWDSGTSTVCSVCGRKGKLGGVGLVSADCHKYFCTYCGADEDPNHVRQLGKWHARCCILYGGGKTSLEIEGLLGSGLLRATGTSTTLGALNLHCPECKTRMPTGSQHNECFWHDSDCSRYRK